MKILFITKFVPYPQDNGGKIGSFSLLKTLCNIGDVDYVSFYENEKEFDYIEQLKSMCKNVIVTFKKISVKKNKLMNIIYFIHSLFSNKPYFIVKFYSREVMNYFKNIDYKNYDLVVIDGLNMAQYIIPYHLSNCVLQEHNVEYKIMERMFKFEVNPIKRLIYYLDYIKLKRYEMNVLKKINNVIFFTEMDVQIISKEKVKINSCVIPVPIEVSSFKLPGNGKWEFKKEIYSIGSLGYFANMDGLLWFDKNVLPLIRKKHPDAKFYHIGYYGEDIKNQLSNNINLIGYVDNINQYMNSNIIHIVPLRIGGGIRVKILNSLAGGIPLVATEMAAEGIMAENQRDLSIVKTAEEFAEEVNSLLDDPDKRIRYINNSQRTAKLHYSEDVVSGQVKKLAYKLSGSKTYKPAEPFVS